MRSLAPAGAGIRRRAVGVRALVWLTALVVFLFAADISSAQPLPFGPGTRVRVTTSGAYTFERLIELVDPSLPLNALVITEMTVAVNADGVTIATLPRPGSRFTGVLQTIDDRVMTIKPDRGHALVTVPRAAVATLERSAGGGGRGRHAAIGLLVGAGVGALAGAISEVGCDPHRMFGCWMAAAVGGGAILGAGVGAVTGAVLPLEDVWVPADAPVAPARTPSLAVTHKTLPGRWSAVVGTGYGIGGPAPDIEQAMRTAGYGDTEAHGFLSPDPISHPFSRGNGLPFSADARYLVRPAWAVAFQWRHTPVGETLGFHQAGYQFLFINSEVHTVAVSASRQWGAMRIGAGPAWQIIRTRDLARSNPWHSQSRLGLLAEFGVRMPTHTPLHLDLNVQYRYIGALSIGPYQPVDNVYTPTVLPALRATFSHWVLGVGSGLRF